MAPRSESGFALPLVVFLIAIVTMLLTSAFTRVQSDRRIGDSSGANVSAMSIAKAALHNYLGTRTTRPADGDSIRINVTGGYADVIAKVLRKPADTLANWLFVVRAVGYVIDPTQGADPRAVRTVAQFAQWQTGRMDIHAVYTAANQLKILSSSGATVDIRGTDACGSAPAAAGVRVANGSEDVPYDGDGYVYSGGTYWYFYGSPPQNEADSKSTVALNTNIDWYGIENGALTPDRTTLTTGDWNFYTQLITGNATLNTWGSGILIVTGDLTLTGGFAAWYGIVLVGGRIYFNSDFNYVLGKVVSGLDEGLGVGISKTDIGDKTTYLWYCDAYVTQALSRLTGFAPITNGWIDNWATY